MAKSKFLQYQDKNSDKLVDSCEDLIEVEETKFCPECRPNPFALVPAWKELTEDSPFLNEKICKYQITVVTSYEDTNATEDSTEEDAEAAIQDIYAEYAQAAAEGLIAGFSKDDSDTSIDAVQSSLEYTDFYLDVRPVSKLKLLFSIELNIIDSLNPESLKEEDEDEEEEESDQGDTTVTYEPQDLATKLIRVRKGLGLYNRYLKVYRALGDGNIVFEDGGVGQVFNLEDYTGRNGLLGKTLRELDTFLNSKGYNILGVGSRAKFRKDTVTKLELIFDSEYFLKKLKIWTVECGGQEIVFNKKRLKSLRNSSSFKDATAMSYLSKLEAMEIDLTAFSGVVNSIATSTSFKFSGFKSAALSTVIFNVT